MQNAGAIFLGNTPGPARSYLGGLLASLRKRYRRLVIPCESEWQLDPPGTHLGLAQFSRDTWEKAKCSPDADYREPWEQGCAVARWMAMIPGRWGTTAGWPWCWR